MAHICDICGRTFARKYDLMVRHSKLHESNPEMFYCPYPDCKRSTRGFLQKSNMEYHVKAKHDTHDGEALICDIDGCNRRYQSSASLRRHQTSSHRTDTTHATRADKKLKARRGGSICDKKNSKGNIQVSSIFWNDISASARPTGYGAAEASATLPSSSFTNDWPPSNYSPLQLNIPPVPPPLSSQYSPFAFDAFSNGIPHSPLYSDLSSCASSSSSLNTPFSPYITLPTIPGDGWYHEVGSDAASEYEDLRIEAGFAPVKDCYSPDIEAWLSANEPIINPLAREYADGLGLLLSDDAHLLSAQDIEYEPSRFEDSITSPERFDVGGFAVDGAYTGNHMHKIAMDMSLWHTHSAYGPPNQEASTSALEPDKDNPRSLSTGDYILDPDNQTQTPEQWQLDQGLFDTMQHHVDFEAAVDDVYRFNQGYVPEHSGPLPLERTERLSPTIRDCSLPPNLSSLDYFGMAPYF